MTASFHALPIARVRALTRDAIEVTLSVPDALSHTFRHIQGQHLTVRAVIEGEELRRSYSICSRAGARSLAIAIKRVDDGVFSSWAQRGLVEGGVLEVLPPAGSFHVDLAAHQRRHYVAFVAGSGITPILSIIETTLALEPDSQFTLFYGNRSSGTVLFKEELENLKDRYMTRFQLAFILSREQHDLDLFHGRIDREKADQLLRNWIDPANIDIAFLCGPQAMMDAARDALMAAGVSADKIKREHFVAGERSVGRARAMLAMQVDENNAAACEVTVRQDGVSRHFTMGRGNVSVLDAALAHGVELPYSCKAGVCSTCRCKRTLGEVEMDVNFALEDYEVARGFILTCQSFPLGDHLTLDFDALV